MLAKVEPRPYCFPALGNLDVVAREAEHVRRRQLEAAVDEAIAQGVAEGLRRGRLEAEREAQEVREEARRHGYQEGRTAGLQEAQQAASILREALAQFELERRAVLADAEAFCVDLALAVVARLVDARDARTEFVRRMIKLGVATLAPDNVTVVLVNAADRAILGDVDGLPLRDDDDLAPGSARVEAGGLLVQGSIDEAFEQIRTAVLEFKSKRTGRSAKPKERQK